MFVFQGTDENGKKYYEPNYESNCFPCPYGSKCKFRHALLPHTEVEGMIVETFGNKY
jgi:hypothetical protein